MKVQIKSSKLFLTLAFLSFATCFPGIAQEVSCTLEIPATATAGTEVPVKVTIHKGQNSDFARFQQPLPDGFKIRPVNTANADFSFRNQTADFIWLKLPETETITLEYMVIPDSRLTGIFKFSGRFSFIHDNDRDEVVAPVKKIEITAPAEAVENQVQGKSISYKLAVFRGQPVRQPDGNGWIVHLLVSRANIEKLGRIEESIPKGFRAENVDGKGAIFSYKDGKLKYIWMTLPEEPLFVVTYRVKPAGGTGGMPAMDGLFSFMKDNEPRSIPIIPTERDITSGLDNRGLEDLYTALIRDVSVEMIQKGVPSEMLQTAPSQGAKSAETLLAEEQQKETSQPVTGESENKPGQKTEIVTHSPEPKEGIYFRVQIIATSKPIQIEAYFKEHRIPGRIYREYIGGLYKYTTGSFTLYREARTFIDDLFKKTDIQEAFVTAYKGDRRISVREALNTTGQKWFK
ncbi:MAG: hypothetical protein GXO83_08695 [Chlorobi bacterium]|nr:hypothetical protein [Chlorobiota bacterium]